MPRLLFAVTSKIYKVRESIERGVGEGGREGGRERERENTRHKQK